MFFQNYIGARSDSLQAVITVAGGRPFSMLTRRRRRVPENLRAPGMSTKLRVETRTHMRLQPHREINDFSTRECSSANKTWCNEKPGIFGSAGQPDSLLVDGLAKLAPGLKTAR